MAISKNSRVGRKGQGEESGYCLPKFNQSTGFRWKYKRDLKKANRGKGITSGSTKGDNCKASSIDRYMAKTSRSYKHPGYRSWFEKTDLRKGRF